MSISRGFAFDVLACAVLGIMLWAACAGIGYRILPRPREPRGDDEPASWRQPGVAACIGLSALVMLGGITVMLEIPWWLVVIPFLVVGLVFAMQELRGFAFRDVPTPVRVIGAVGGAALLLVALVQAVPGLRFPLNTCDDMRGYLALAQRLVDTGGLAEPWSARRLQNLGGFTFLQALPVSVFGFAGIGVVEMVLSTIFLAGLFVANGLRAVWTRVVSVGLILVIPLLWVPRVNTTGVLMGSPLFIGLLACTAELRKEIRAGNRSAAFRWAIAGGLIAAALTSVRPPMGVLAVLILALGALVDRGSAFLVRLRVLAVAGASSLLAIAPWSIASLRTVNTPLFPVFTGNQNLDAVRSPPRGTVLNVLDQAIRLLGAGPYVWIAVGVLIIAIVAYKLLPDPPLVALAAIATCVVVVVFAINESFAPRQAFVRYIAPMSGGLAIFLVCETLRAADTRARTAGSRVWIPAMAIVAAVALAAVGFSSVGVSLEYPPLPSGGHFVDLAARDAIHPMLPGLDVTTPALSRAYRQALRHVEPDTTIAAVDRPYLIDYGRYDIPSLDLPGFTTPDGKFPFFTGPRRKVDRLRRAGYDTLLATVPDTDACLPPWVLRIQRQVRVKNYSRYARYYLDWEDDLAQIAQRAPDAVQAFGPLLVIDLRRAERDLTRSEDRA